MEQKCQHNYKIIRKEEGYRHKLLFGGYCVIYHLQCKKCGVVHDFIGESICRKCNNKVEEF